MHARPSRLQRFIRISGVTFAVCLMLFLLADHVVMPLYTQQGRTTKVPDVLGMPSEEARQVLLLAGLEPKESESKPDRTYPIGTVSLQTPRSGSLVKFSRGVYLTISGGDIIVDVPNLRGKSLRDATFTLESAGLRLGEVRYEPSDEIFMNTVISQSYDPERKIKTGSAVGVVVSQGKAGEKRTVPNVVMRSLAEAERMLLQSGFRLGTVTKQPNFEILPNTVLDQYPKAGEMSSFGQTVDVFISEKGENPTELEN